ncbi:BglG family transcription antiterminator [Schnuerera sp. xch1]|uniref:BglG family transcription antiterminator n=1 Tax=Schnuerera sp. xch1 TaxID=2874283 RepID=UPI001CBB3B3B|nr:BglG family transcription antiterminator [Schnuerera sp. xch1]MBZ2175070.1 BglG family transcription antiterminator [Schnuerera sp. xch1]
MDERLMEILKILITSNKSITINRIANKLAVSNRTIRNDLDKLNNVVEKEGLILVRKTGVGISIEGTDENKIVFLKKLEEKNKKYIKPFSPERRRMHILKTLFLGKNNVIPKELAKKLYVSTNTIYKDFEQVDKWLEKYDLRLYKRRNLVQIIGSENNYRRAISNFISETNNLEGPEELSIHKYEGRIDLHTLTKLKILMEVDYEILEKLLEDIEAKLNFKFSQEAFIGLIIHMAIAMKRIQAGKDITISDEIFQSIKDTEEFKCAKKMIYKLQNIFNIQVPKSEIGYIALHILGSKAYEKDFGDINFSFEQAGGLGLSKKIAKDIISIASDALRIDLTRDQKLLNGLILHLRPTINRLKYGLTLQNPMLEEIKSNYPKMYGVSWMTSVAFDKYLDVKITEDEIGYIAMHIGAAAERNKKKIRTLIVCHTGIGTSQLLLAKLQGRFQELDIVGVESSTKIDNYKLTNIDLIISTVPIQVNKQFLIVNPILNKYEIKRLEQFINHKFHLTSRIQKSISKEIFYRSVAFKSKEEIISQMCEALVERQYLKEEFVDTVLKRERLMSTEVGKMLSIPHGDPKEVRDSCIALTVLEYPIVWKYEKVQFVLMICLTEDDLQRGQHIFRNLSNLMEDDNFFNDLKQSFRSAEEALNQLDDKQI